MAVQAVGAVVSGGVAQRVEEARTRAGASRRWIGNQGGLAHAYFSHMIAAPERVRPITLTMVAAALDVSASWLIHGRGDIEALPLPGYPVSFVVPTALVGAKALAREKGRSTETVRAALLKLATGDGPSESAKWWYRRLTAEVDGTRVPRRPGRSGTTKVERDRADADLLSFLGLDDGESAFGGDSAEPADAAWACADRGVDRRAICDS